MKKLIITFSFMLIFQNVYAELCPELDEINELVNLLNTEYSELPKQLQQTETSVQNMLDKNPDKTFGQIIDEQHQKSVAIQNFQAMQTNIKDRIKQGQKNMDAVFKPVCGKTQSGTKKTFKNACQLRQAFAQFVYDGECKIVQPTIKPQPKVIAQPESVIKTEEELKELPSVITEKIESETKKVSTNESMKTEIEILKEKIKELEAKDEPKNETPKIISKNSKEPKASGFLKKFFGMIASWFQ